ncbi:hypothetical protein SETIT_3G228800v2 [Setaria italica]|uniref:Uncharacterized protein n=1 Tax=Setaria italica TaxID=4555 RepID=A0A368QHX3_SETIT|nr:hypothetical protein SETIT_3G228800v2 [Setaria italica]
MNGYRTIPIQIMKILRPLEASAGQLQQMSFLPFYFTACSLLNTSLSPLYKKKKKLSLSLSLVAATAGLAATPFAGDEHPPALVWSSDYLIPPSERYIFNFNSKDELKQWHLYSDSEYGDCDWTELLSRFVICIIGDN